MNKKMEMETQEKQAYVAAFLEICTFEKSDIVTASPEDSQADNDITQSDIF